MFKWHAAFVLKILGLAKLLDFGNPQTWFGVSSQFSYIFEPPRVLHLQWSISPFPGHLSMERVAMQGLLGGRETSVRGAWIVGSLKGFIWAL